MPFSWFGGALGFVSALKKKKHSGPKTTCVKSYLSSTQHTGGGKLSHLLKIGRAHSNPDNFLTESLVLFFAYKYATKISQNLPHKSAK